MIRMHGQRTAPVQRDKVPRKRAAQRANMDPAGTIAMAKVGERQVEKVEDEQKLCEPEVAPHKEIDKAE